MSGSRVPRIPYKEIIINVLISSLLDKFSKSDMIFLLAATHPAITKFTLCDLVICL